MIIDKIENRARYSGLGEKIGRMLNYLAQSPLLELKTGRHEIDGDDVYMIVADYETKAFTESKPEAHRVYADIQFIAEGGELFGYAENENQPAVIPYNTQKDIEFFDAEMSYIKLNSGMFAVVLPGELHQPGVIDRDSVNVRKVVVKVKM